jgi:hypothetical protein
MDALFAYNQIGGVVQLLQQFGPLQMEVSAA